MKYHQTINTKDFFLEKEYNTTNLLLIVEGLKIFFFIALIIFSVLSFYKLPIWSIASTNDVQIANFRATWLISLIMSLFCIGYSMYAYTYTLQNLKFKILFLCTLCIFSFINFKLLVNHKKELSWNYLGYKSDRLLSWTNNYAWVNLFFIATFVIFLWTTFSFLTFPIMQIFMVDNGQITINNSYLFGTFSYFTELTNLACFIYLALVLFTNKSFLLRNLTILTNLVVYILVVMLVFWASRIPSLIDTGNLLDWNGKLAISSNIQTIFLHFIDPIFFLVFAILVRIFRNHTNRDSYGIQYIRFLIYPAMYAVYLYTIVYLVPFSPYGMLTNVNPNMVNDTSSFVQSTNYTQGNYIFYLGILIIWAVLTIVFTIIYFAFKNYSHSSRQVANFQPIVKNTIVY